MSQDLLAEFDPFASRPSTTQPPALPPARPSRAPPAPPAHRLQPQHHRTTSATTFDDLLGISPFPGDPHYKSPAVRQLQEKPARPVSYHGGSPNMNMLVSLDEDFPSPNKLPNKSGGGGGALDDWGSPAHNENDDDDEFGDFIASPTSTSPGPPEVISVSSGLSLPRSSSTPSFDLSFLSNAAPTRPPPQPQLQVPQVATLLALFPPLFLLPEQYLLTPLKNLSYPLRQRTLSSPQVREFLRGFCELARVAGRIIAARKRRRRGTGARAVNVTKEEREVGEVVRCWQEAEGRVRALVSGEEARRVPKTLAEEVRGTARGEGCRLCTLGKGELVGGLREEERAKGWWIEGWGHGGCKRFLEKHGKEARGR